MWNRRSLSVALLAALCSASAFAEPLKYSGALMDAGKPAEGAYALRLSLYDAANGGRRVGNELTLADVPVSAGRFSADLDFGLPSQLMGKFWMQVEVAGPEGVFEPLGKRESLDAKALATAACWSTEGNAGTDPAADFLGTTDATGLTLRVANQAAFRILPPGGSPNIIMGSPSNSIAAGMSGNTIGGGGAEFSPHIVSGSLGTIAGGRSNEISGGLGGSIGGGSQNRILGPADGQTVGGGSFNTAAGSTATIPGGNANVAGGAYSFAAGHRAAVRGNAAIGQVPGAGVSGGDQGTFVWADSSNPSAYFVSTGRDQFLIRSAGGVGINRAPASADVELTIEGRLNDAFQGNVDLVFIPSANGTDEEGIAIAAGKGGVGTNDAIFTIAQRNSTQFVSRFRIDTDGATRNTTGAWSTLSDARVKRGIEPIPSPLATLLGLRGHRFEYTDAAPGMNDGKRLGFVAQEVREVLPQWVRLGSDGYYSVTPTGFEALTVEAMRELAEENVALQSDNAALHTANEELRAAQTSLGKRLAAVEAQLRQRTR